MSIFGENLFRGKAALITGGATGVGRGIDAIARHQRTHHGCGHAPLQFEQAHGATATGAARYFSALRASACTSSNVGMRSSHSSSVAVGPTR